MSITYCVFFFNTEYAIRNSFTNHASRNNPMFWQMITIEQSKITRRAILWVELALLALAVIILHVAIYAAIQAGEFSSEGMPPELVEQMEQSLIWPAGLAGALDFASGPNLGGLLIIVLVGAVVAQEYTWRTLQLWLSQGVSRPLFLAAKFIALLLPILLMVLVPLLFGGLITALFTQQITGSIPFGDIEWGRVLLNALSVAYTLLPYAGLAFFLAVLSRSTIVAIGGGLAYALLLEGIVVELLGFVGGIWGQIGQYLPAGLARGLLAMNGGLTVEIEGTMAPAVPYLDPVPAAIGIALYTLLFLGLSILIFRRQDLGG
jgi:ABC-type transport system involved in multi-copper enzyme maturation permease subunit